MDMPMKRESMFNTIQNFLSTIKNKKEKIVLWQNLNDSRTKVTAVISKFSKDFEHITLLPENGNFKISSHCPVYFYTPWKTTIFKSTVCFNSKFKIELRVPKTILYAELRQFERSSIQQDINAIFRKVSNIPNINFYTKKILDFSDQGIGLRIPATDQYNFEINDHLEFTLKNKQIVIGKVIYITFIENDNYERGAFFRVGVKFEEQVDSIQF